MFNIKIGVATDADTEAEYRTVVLTKTNAEIDGKIKLILMIRDVTDKVRLEQEQIKKTKHKDKIFRLSSHLDEIFKQHQNKVNTLCTLTSIEKETPPAIRNFALDVKRSNCDLFLNFCQFSDLIAI
jgi:chemotaxis signal transduction protein